MNVYCMFLYDFKLRIEDKDTKICKLSYNNQNSKRFLEYYQEYGFEKYINDFDLGEFVKKDENNKIIGITNLGTEDTGATVIQDEFDSFVWSNSYGIENKKAKMKSYFDNLVDICHNAQKQN